MSEGSSGGSSRAHKLPGPDWCGLLKREGPLGLLGAPAIAPLCGLNSWPEGRPLTLEWHGAKLPVNGGGPPALLGAPPRSSVETAPIPLVGGAGGYSANPLLHRRLTPGFSALEFPGCIIHPDGETIVGAPTLEPLEAKKPGACKTASWREARPPLLAGHPIRGVESCLETVKPDSGRLRLCRSGSVEVVESSGAALALGGVTLGRVCSDYIVRVLHSGGFVTFYAGDSWNGAAPVVVLECPRGSLYASSPGTVRIRIEPDAVELKPALEGWGLALGSGGLLRAAAALYEALVDPGFRWDRPTPGHARCGGCVGAAWLGSDSLWLYAWAPTSSGGMLEVRLRVIDQGRAKVVDALGESWVPIERGLFRVPVPPGWHVVVRVDIEEWERPSGGRLVEILKRRLTGLEGGGVSEVLQD